MVTRLACKLIAILLFLLLVRLIHSFQFAAYDDILLKIRTTECKLTGWFFGFGISPLQLQDTILGIKEETEAGLTCTRRLLNRM